MKSSSSFKKLSLGLVLMTGGVFASFGTVSAAEEGPQFYIPYDGYDYVKSSESTYLDITWSHYHSNPGSTTDTVTHSVSRTKETNATVSTSASFNTMVAEVGIGTEVGWGSSKNVTTSVTYTIPARTNYTLRYGSRAVKTSGYENRYSDGRKVASKYVTGNWTYQGYSDKK